MRCNRLMGQLWRNGRFRHHRLFVFMWLLILALLAPIISPLFGFNPAAFLHTHDHIYLGVVNLRHHDHPVQGYPKPSSAGNQHTLRAGGGAELPDVLLVMDNIVDIGFLIDLPANWQPAGRPVDDVNLADSLQHHLHQILEVFLPPPKKPPRLISQITF